MWQVVQKVQPAWPMPENAAKVFEKCAEAREEVITDLQLSRTEGKRVLLEVANGGSGPAHLSGHDVIRSLRQACTWIKWLAVGNFPDVYDHCEADKTKLSPDNSTIAYLYQAVEDLVLTSWTNYLASLDLLHLSLHFDGCRIQGRQSLDIEHICQESSRWIAQETGFRVVIRQKQHLLLKELVIARGEVCEQLEVSPALSLPANRIFSCLAQLSGQWDRAEMLVKEHGELAKDQRHRSYKECFNAMNLFCEPGLGGNVSKPGKYLLHSEHDGSPLVIGCVTGENKTCKLFVDTTIYQMQADALCSCVEEAVDSSSVVKFLLCTEEVSRNNASHEQTDVLLEMQAGGAHAGDISGGSNASGFCEQTLEGEGLGHDSDDEGLAGMAAEEPDFEAIVRVGDTLLTLLQSERNKVLDDGHSVSDGCKHRCSLCPFRLFTRPARVRGHIQKHHSKKKQFCCSGTKQLRVIQALFDDDQMRGIQPTARYLRRSATILRASLGKGDENDNKLDRQIRLVLTEKGPLYKPADLVMADTAPYRRAKNLYYTHGFADLVFQEMLVCHAKAKQVTCPALVDFQILFSLHDHQNLFVKDRLVLNTHVSCEACFRSL